MSQRISQKVFLDCDPGVDDALALGLILSQPVELLGVATVAGNIEPHRGAINALALLELAGHPDIPVAVGSTHPLGRDYDGGVPHIHGSDGCGNIGLSTDLATAECDGADLLINTIRSHPHEVDVIAVGPVTNLAIALERDPDIVGLVKSLNLMGGAFWAPGNITPYAEANLGHDVAAAARVFAAPWSGYLAPLDATLKTRLSAAHIEALANADSAVCQKLGQMLDFYARFHLDALGFYGCALHDPLAVAATLGLVTPHVRTGAITIDHRDTIYGRTHLWHADERISSLPDPDAAVLDDPTPPPTGAGEWAVIDQGIDTFGDLLVAALTTLP